MSVAIAWERRGTGAPLLLVHGLGYARWGWEPVVERLALTHEVLLFDNRGIGASEAPPGPYTVAQMAGDAVRVLDDAGMSRAHVLGTSLGGMIAQELALSRPDRVDRLVLVSTTPGGPNAVPMPAATRALLEDAPALDPAVALRRLVENALAPGADPAIVDRILAHRHATAQPAPAWQAQAAAGASFDAWDRLPKLGRPTLVVHGSDDTVVDPGNTRLLAQRIPDGRMQLLAGCGHLPFWEQPSRFVETVAAFLR